MLQLMVMKNFFSVNVGLSVMRNVIYAVLGTTVRAEALALGHDRNVSSSS